MIISNVKFINPVNETIERIDMEISEGRVEAVRTAGSMTKDGTAQRGFRGFSESERIIDGRGLYMAPGFCDIHSHFRDPGYTHKEDIASGAMAAKCGGYTDIILMANTNPVVDNTDTLSYVLNKGLTTGIHINTCASVTKGLKGEETVDFGLLHKRGAKGFTDDGIPIMDEEVLKRAMLECKKLEVPISLHEEDKSLISENGINSNIAESLFNLKGSPKEAEISMVKRDIEIAKETGCNLNIQHVSAKETVELVREAHKAGFSNIYAEATPHHFSLTEEDVKKYGTNAKMNPPLRTNEDRLAIIEGIKDGTISFIATDHAPHAKAEKEQEITKAPSGIIGLETAFPLAYENLVMPGYIDLIKLVKLMSLEPRKLYNMPCPGISIGDSADFVLFSTDEEWKYEETRSKSFNSPFRGKKLHGKVKFTICGGRIVYEDL